MLPEMFNIVFGGRSKDDKHNKIRDEAKREMFMQWYGAKTKLSIAVYRIEKYKKLLRKYKIKLYSPVISDKNKVIAQKQVNYYAKKVEESESIINEYRSKYNAR